MQQAALQLAGVIAALELRDPAGLRAAHAAGFDQVVVKSALVERCREIVAELTPSA